MLYYEKGGDIMNVGERIKKIRKEQGLSVDELAVLLGKDRATIYRYESNDIKSMPLDILVPISEALGVSPVYIMGLTDDKHFSLSENVYLDDKETEMIMVKLLQDIVPHLLSLPKSLN